MFLRVRKMNEWDREILRYAKTEQNDVIWWALWIEKKRRNARENKKA